MSGGGVALGPKPRSYRQHTPKKMVRLALLSALSDRAATNRVALVDQWGWEGPKTKDAVAALANLKVTGTVLVVLADDRLVVGQHDQHGAGDLEIGQGGDGVLGLRAFPTPLVDQGHAIGGRPVAEGGEKGQADHLL